MTDILFTLMQLSLLDLQDLGLKFLQKCEYISNIVQWINWLKNLHIVEKGLNLNKTKPFFMTNQLCCTFKDFWGNILDNYYTTTQQNYTTGYGVSVSVERFQIQGTLSIQSGLGTLPPYDIFGDPRTGQNYSIYN